jgi:hypothetical protein
MAYLRALPAFRLWQFSSLTKFVRLASRRYSVLYLHRGCLVESELHPDFTEWQLEKATPRKVNGNDPIRRAKRLRRRGILVSHALGTVVRKGPLAGYCLAEFEGFRIVFLTPFSKRQSPISYQDPTTGSAVLYRHQFWYSLEIYDKASLFFR